MATCLRTLRLLSFLILITAACLCAASAETPSSTEFVIKTWEVKDGVFAIALDTGGYLWLGTGDGLLRFDGMRFQSWEGSPLLRSAIISSLCASRDGTLWIGLNSGGIAHLRGRGVTFYESRDGMLGGPIRSITEDREGTIWAAGGSGLARFRAGRWERIGMSLGLPERPIDGLYEDSKGSLWVGSVSGIFRRNRDADRFEAVATSDYWAVSVSSFTEDQDGSLWITDVRRALRKLGAPAQRNDASIAWVRRGSVLTSDGRRNIWIGSYGHGLGRLRGRRADGALDIQWMTPKDGLVDDTIMSIFTDRDGDVWVGGLAGLSRVSASSFTRVIGGVQLDAIGHVRGVTTTADGSVWVNSDEGLRSLSNGRWRSFGAAEGLLDRIDMMSADGSGSLWVGTSTGVSRLVGGRFVRLDLPILLNRIRAVTVDAEGVVWLGDAAQGVFRWQNGRLAPTPLSGLPTFAAHTDRRGGVWFGFADGRVARHQHGQFEMFTTDQGLPGGRVNAIYEDSKEVIWVGTSEGVSWFHNGGFVRAFQGTPLNVSSIIEDLDGYLWIGDSRGLVRFERSALDVWLQDPSRKVRFTTYGTPEGLLGTPFRAGGPCAARGPDGSLWFVTTKSVAIIHPGGRIPQYATPETPIVETAIADDRPLDIIGTGVTLPPRTARLEIRYTAVELRFPERLRFRYRLDGYDRDWVEVDGERQAVYTKLPPGQYRLQIAAYYEGVWSESVATWSFAVAPMFYQTTWFKISWGAASILLIVGAWRWRLRHLRQRFALILGERVRVSREIHDTLLQGLVGAVMQLDVIGRQFESEPQAARHRLTRIRCQLDFYVSEARRSIRNLRSGLLQGANLSSALREMGERLTADTSVRFELSVAGEPSPSEAAIAEHFLRIGQEAINNALHHGEPTTIRVELVHGQDSVRLRVIDDGHGFDLEGIRQSPNGGWGFVTIRERAEQCGATLHIASWPDRGTTVEVTAPIGRSHGGESDRKRHLIPGS